MKKILIVRLGAIGDVIHTSSLFRAIKRLEPDIEVHYLVSKLIKPLLSADKDISKVIETPKKFNLFSYETFKLIKQLKQENYSFAFNLQPSLKTRIVLLLAGIKKQYIYKKTFKQHAVINFWQTGLKAFPNLEKPLDLKLYLPEETLQKAKERLKNLKRPLIVLNAGGMLSKRQGRAYPINKWLDLGAKLSEKFGGAIIITGAEEDKEMLMPLSKLNNAVNYSGRLSLEDSFAVISQTDLMISGDSGPLHAACALGVKSIGLYGSMPADRTGCFCSGINIISKKACAPCNKRKCRYLKGSDKIYAPCMEEISSDEIFETAAALLENYSAQNK